MFTSKKIAHDIKVAEAKAPLINQHCVVYKFRCDLCDAVLADTFSNALRNTSTLLLENTCVTPSIRGTKIFVNNLPFLRNVVGNLNA